MNILLGMLPPSWLYIGFGLYLLTWIAVLRTIPWRRLLDNSLSHGFLGTCVLLLALWHVSTPQFPGLNYHFLGAGLLALMFRWQLAFVGVNLILLAMLVNGETAWQTLPINALTMGLIPILACFGIYRFAEWKLPRHLFVYIFVNAFFGSALAIAVAVLLSILLLTTAGVYQIDNLIHDYLPFLPLMMFPESFITGMLITLAVVFYPQWVLTFDDAKYLK